MHHIQYQKNELMVEGVAVADLVKRHGSPLYIYSAQTLIDHYQSLSQSMSPVDHRIHYAVKANSNLAVLKTLAKQGSQFDIVSAGELTRVLRAGGKAEHCTFAGVGKTDAEIEFALKEGIYSFIVESESELSRIDLIAKKLKVQAPVALRVNPNVDAGTHAKITTGTYDNKFGVNYEFVRGIYERAARKPNLWLRGIHIHIGSQITKAKPFQEAVRKMLPLVQELKDQFHIEFFDIGGGIGVVYDPALESGKASWWKKQKKPPLTPQLYADKLLPHLKKLKMTILLEPGRFLSANAGILVAQVIDVKEALSKRFVIVDAAMNDLARPSMYEAYHEIIPFKKSRAQLVSTDVVGPVCESGDTFCKNRPLPPVQQGDLVALMSAGAYGFTMAGNYNTRPMPAEILVKGTKARCVRKRQSLDDLLELETA
ncbi:MAG: diaminopimelate decarboxylase [Verrucomicrobiota bacterium]